MGKWISIFTDTTEKALQIYVIFEPTPNVGNFFFSSTFVMSRCVSSCSCVLRTRCEQISVDRPYSLLTHLNGLRWAKADNTTKQRNTGKRRGQNKQSKMRREREKAARSIRTINFMTILRLCFVHYDLCLDMFSLVSSAAVAAAVAVAAVGSMQNGVRQCVSCMCRDIHRAPRRSSVFKSPNRYTWWHFCVRVCMFLV